jgi:hypothetical protein
VLNDDTTNEGPPVLVVEDECFAVLSAAEALDEQNTTLRAALVEIYERLGRMRAGLANEGDEMGTTTTGTTSATGEEVSGSWLLDARTGERVRPATRAEVDHEAARYAARGEGVEPLRVQVWRDVFVAPDDLPGRHPEVGYVVRSIGGAVAWAVLVFLVFTYVPDAVDDAARMAAGLATWFGDLQPVQAAVAVGGVLLASALSTAFSLWAMSWDKR